MVGGDILCGISSRSTTVKVIRRDWEVREETMLAVVVVGGRVSREGRREKNQTHSVTDLLFLFVLLSTDLLYL